MTEEMWQTLLVEPGRFVRERVARPKPGPGEVLVQVAHVGVCGSDIAAYHGKHPYISCPVVLGHEFSGTVAQLGPGTEGPVPGARVTVIPHLACWQCPACQREAYNLCHQLRVIGCQTPGAHAEHVLVPSHMVIAIPEEIDIQDAALVEPAAVAVHAVKRAAIGPGDRVLVVGAGPIGNFTMQAAQSAGGEYVCITDLDTSRLALAKSLGADGTIDLSSESLKDGLAHLIGGPKEVDVWADCVGHGGEVLDQILALARRGSRILVVGILTADYRIPHLPNLIEHELSVMGTSMYVPADYPDVLEQLSAGGLRTAGMVTDTYSMEQIPQAFAMIDDGEQKFFKIMFSA